MIIVSGWLRIAPEQRDEFVRMSHDSMAAARQTAGCHAFVVAPDPIEPDRVNVYEEWESDAALESFRGEGPEPELGAAILDASVSRHQVASSGPA